MNDVTVKVKLTANQISNLVDFIEFEFIDSIRRDEDVDNIDYIVSMCDALKTLRNARTICNGRKKSDNYTEPR